MGSVTIDGLMEGFSSLLHQAKPSAVPEFMAWVDRQVSEYKRSWSAQSDFESSCVTFSNAELHFNNSQLAKDMKRLKTLISDSNQNKITSQASSVNLSPPANGRVTALLSADYASPSNKLTLKVPYVSPTQSQRYYGSPASSGGSPRPGCTPMKASSALRNLLQSTARVNLGDEFDDPVESDPDNACSQDESAQPRVRIDCQLCGKMFLHRSSYRRHLKLHQGVFTHHCADCDRKFSRKEHFQRHKCSRKSFNKDRNDLDSSFDSVTDSPVKSNLGWCGRLQSFHLPTELLPLDMSSKASEEGSIDTNETSSMSSGQISPAQSSEGSKQRAGRKSSAPRKIDSSAFHENDDYMSDIDESMYESKEADAAGDEVIDMSIKKECGLTGHADGGYSKSVDAVQREERHAARPAQEAAVSVTSHAQTGRDFGVPSNDNISPPPGFRIGDLIESAVTKYHSAFERAKLNVPFLPTTNDLSSPYTPYPSSPKMKAKMYAKMYAAGEGTEMAKTLPKAEEGGQKGNFLATETGTYQITTEEIGTDSVLVENTTSKVIKVVKQGNYLKLKKEAQLIDGELRFICPHCCKVFHRSSNFSRHMRIHRGVYSYICSTCNRGFYRKEHFDKHKCYRKSMATTWERKTKVDLDRDTPEKCNKENDFFSVNGEGAAKPASVFAAQLECNGAMSVVCAPNMAEEDIFNNGTVTAHAD